MNLLRQNNLDGDESGEDEGSSSQQVRPREPSSDEPNAEDDEEDEFMDAFEGAEEEDDLGWADASDSHPLVESSNGQT